MPFGKVYKLHFEDIEKKCFGIKKEKKNPFPHIFDSENLSGLIWSCSWLHPLSSNSVPSFPVSPQI